MGATVVFGTVVFGTTVVTGGITTPGTVVVFGTDVDVVEDVVVV